MKDILRLIDEKLAKAGKEYLKIIDYDIKSDLDIEEMYLLVIYRKALLNKLRYCNDCFRTFNKSEISSKILKIIYS